MIRYASTSWRTALRVANADARQTGRRMTVRLRRIRPASRHGLLWIVSEVDA